MCDAVTHFLRVACDSHSFKVKYHFCCPAQKARLDYTLAWCKKIETLCNPTLKEITLISMFMAIPLLMRQSELAEVVSKDLH